MSDLADWNQFSVSIARNPPLVRIAIGSLLLAGVLSFCCPTDLAAKETSVRAKLNVRYPGNMVPVDFVGLSFEASLLLPDYRGVHYFRPDNYALIQLFQTLGIKSLRIGGNTSDRTSTQLPGPADWDDLFAFAQAAEVKVIYTLKLCHGEELEAAQTVKYMTDHYGPLIDCFSIGQEPSAYPATIIKPLGERRQVRSQGEKYLFPDYARDWKRFADTIVDVVPSVRFCGPGVHNDPRWAQEFIATFGRSNHVTLITEHLYPGGAGDAVVSPKIGREQMLGNGFVETYQNLCDGLRPLSSASGLPYRLEEVNNFYNSGATNVSNTFAAALWGLDFMFWWATHDAAGLNFHTGDFVAADANLRPSKYTAFCSTSNGYAVRPLGYAIKAFEVGSHGRCIPVEVSSSANSSLSIYAVLGENNNLYVTVINKESDRASDDTTLILNFEGFEYCDSEFIRLAAQDDDIAASEGQTLGGAEIKENGSWSGQWRGLTQGQGNIAKSDLIFRIRPATACIIRLNGRKGR